MAGITKLVEAKTLKDAGGKAYALGEMLRSGFMIPDGFVISDMPPTSEVLAAFDELKTEYVAVRSSAEAEDGKNDAWAGQFETFINVRRDELLRKIDQCFKSGESTRAKSYAKQKGIAVGSLSVIVQKMIQGEISGVAFSVNPINNDPREMVIEAALGLNEAVVSGEVTPDTYIISRKNMDILKTNISRQVKKLILADRFNQWVTIEANEQKLGVTQIKELAHEVEKLENHFNYPVDAEWTYHQGRFYILQCRPITTLN